MQFLKQSTAATVKIGPCVDSSDGVTAETGLTINQAAVRLSKNGGNFAQKNESATATHDENGYYDVALDATDSGTLGRLLLAVNVSGSLPVWQEFMVVPAGVYDSLFGSDKLEVDAVQVGGTAQTAGDIFAQFPANFSTLTIANNAVDADVERWRGSVPLVLTAGGILQVDLDAVNGETDVDNYFESRASTGVNGLGYTAARAGNLDNLAALTPNVIVKRRTFRSNVDGVTAQNVVTLATWSSGTVTLSADFGAILHQQNEGQLNPGTTIASITSVTVVKNSDSSTVTTSNLVVRQGKRAINFDVATISTAGAFTVTAKVLTTDGQTLTLKGNLIVE